MSPPIFFATPDEFRDWLEINAADATEVWVGFFRKGARQSGITWSQAVDQALRFGWIDGVRKGIDDERYMIRFTPRRPGSIWSAVNVKRAEALLAEGSMRPAGAAAFAQRAAGRTGVYSHEQGASVELGDEFERLFRANADAWSFFQAQSASYRRAAAWWVVSAKRDETRRRRLATLIDDSAAGRTLPQFTRQSRHRETS
ncbi:MAG TPA: YdeI/OmpD-associated family protein [Thermomicrobiales bacterium]|nr:YdeI/OmpD-associated family protein [Thermomicrobiales bacterium]